MLAYVTLYKDLPWVKTNDHVCLSKYLIIYEIESSQLRPRKCAFVIPAVTALKLHKGSLTPVHVTATTELYSHAHMNLEC